MIIVRTKGRIGNLLFQYAAAKQIANDNNTEVRVDVGDTNFERPYGADGNDYSLKFFNIPVKITTEEEKRPFLQKSIFSFLERVLPLSHRRLIWEKNNLPDQKIIGIKRKNLYLVGYFQSEKYFKGIEDELRKEITLRDPITEKCADIIKQMQTTNSVSVHSRRGDILKGKVVLEKPSGSIEYFQKAAEEMREKLGNPHFYVFSDDPAWVKENFSFLQPVTFISGGNLKDYEELMLMSYCKNNIISHSTFGWWAAWLNKNPKKIVIAPKQWFLDPVKNKIYTENLLPPSWIKI